MAEGGKKLRVRPDLGDLTFIEGVVPTAYGDVKIRCDKKGANVEVKIDAPRKWKSFDKRKGRSQGCVLV